MVAFISDKVIFNLYWSLLLSHASAVEWLAIAILYLAVCLLFIKWPNALPEAVRVTVQLVFWSMISRVKVKLGKTSFQKSVAAVKCAGR